MALLTLHNLIDVGTSQPNYIAGNTGGDQALNHNGATRLWVINANDDARDLIFVSNDSEYGDYPDLVYSIPAQAFHAIPPLNMRRFNDSAGRISWTYSTGASQIEVAAVEDDTILKDPV